MMLQFDEFVALWQQDFAFYFPNQNLQTLFQSYLIRENHLEDFLDIYRGYDTRTRRGYTNNSPHRFNHLFLGNYNIKYILVAEAAPFGNNYIYRNASGSYITAPLNAFNVSNVRNLSSTARLENLAACGILVLDLFPFNLAFNERQGAVRHELIKSNTTLNYLIDLNNSYSIINRVNNLIATIPNCKLGSAVNAAFMATPLINNYLSMHISGITLNPLGFQSGVNRVANNKICNGFGNSYDMGNLTAVPKFSADGCAASGSPHATLIKNALNL
jgi:hypothetical protein